MATFDTHKLITRLAATGMPVSQAEALSDALKESQDELVTKKDLEIALAPIKADILVMKWMMGFVLAGIMALIIRAFFAS